MPVIVEVGNSQFEIEEGAILKVDLMDAKPGDKVQLDKVLAVIGGGPAVFGRPYIQGAAVEATVVKHGRGKKIDVFTYKSKKRERKTIGHRQDFTEIKIDKISAV